jgi:non-heme chloroperoxidase
VLLAGYATAHVYDDFAPHLTAIGHVYGITRRGLGASSRPESGYTSERQSEDIVRVLDTLKLAKPVLIGHSFGGTDQTILAENHPQRIAALVYLDSAGDPTVRDYGVKPPDGKKLPAARRERPHPDFNSIQAYQAWGKRTYGVAFPESEVRQLYALNPDGTMGNYLVSSQVRDGMFKGLQKPDFARIKVPVLAFFRVPASLEEEIREYPPQNEEERTALEQQHRFEMAVEESHVQDLKKGVPSARVVELANANSYIFLSNEADVLPELETFVKKLR